MYFSLGACEFNAPFNIVYSIRNVEDKGMRTNIILDDSNKLSLSSVATTTSGMASPISGTLPHTDDLNPHFSPKAAAFTDN